MRILLALLLAALLGLPASARPLSQAETQGLDAAITRYLAAIRQGNAEAIVTALPPRILNVFAGATGQEAGKLEKALVEQTRTLMKGTSFRELASKQAGLDASEARMPDGAGILWTLVPTTFISQTGGASTRHWQQLLALREGGTWYFLRIDGPERQQFAAIAYPFLASVQFPPATSAPVE